MSNTRKKVFAALATVKTDGGKKKLALLAPEYWQSNVDKLQENKKYGIVVEEYKATRSQAQLAYYWVVLGYLADDTGHSPEELHDAIMRQKFGVKKIEVGGINQTVRKSISNAANFPKSDMVELIMEALDICEKVGVRVPSKQELGYI